MADTCTRCNKSIYAAENPVRVPGGVYHTVCFKCSVCASTLTLKTVTTKEGAIYCKSHIPTEVPDQGVDVKTQGFINAPKQHMGARNLDERGSGQGSAYGAGSVDVERAIKSPKAPTNVNQINKMEVRHNGVDKFSS